MVQKGVTSVKLAMEKLEHFVAGRTYGVLRLNNQYQLRAYFEAAGKNYTKK